MARYSAGATLLYDSVPEAEERETRLKATAFFRAMRRGAARRRAVYAPKSEEGRGVRLLLVDNEDCFIHTLANYVRQTGAEVITYRAGFSLDLIESLAPSLILVSPGPGRPSDFGVPDLIRHAAKLEVPVFGVCLGLQGMVEAFGGELGVLDYPMHGKPSLVRHIGAGRLRRPARRPSASAAIILCTPSAKASPVAWKSPRKARTASSWACAIATCPWKRSSFIPNRSSRWTASAA